MRRRSNLTGASAPPGWQAGACARAAARTRLPLAPHNPAVAHLCSIRTHKEKHAVFSVGGSHINSDAWRPISARNFSHTIPSEIPFSFTCALMASMESGAWCVGGEIRPAGSRMRRSDLAGARWRRARDRAGARGSGAERECDGGGGMGRDA